MDEQKPKSMMEIIKEAGYVMVVRCKDCKWRGTKACFCKAEEVEDTWFCSE